VLALQPTSCGAIRMPLIFDMDYLWRTKPMQHKCCMCPQFTVTIACSSACHESTQYIYHECKQAGPDITWPCDLDLWPFDLGQWSYMVGHVMNSSTKFEDPMRICSWLMNYHILHRPLLTMCLEPLLMCSIMWPVHMGKFFPHIWNPCPRSVYTVCNLFGSATKINPVIRQNSVWLCMCMP